MHKILIRTVTLSFAALVVATGATTWTQAQEVGRTERAVTEEDYGVYNRIVTLSPRAGVLGFGDGSDSYTSRLLSGITLDWNISNQARTKSPARVGFETGILYSHIGAPANSNFFGTGDAGGGGNTFLFPLNLVAGYQVNDTFHVAGRLGADLIYRSIANTMTLGRSDASTGSSSDFFPGLGLTAGWLLGRSVALDIRGDYIITPADDMFSAMLGATIPLA